MRRLTLLAERPRVRGDCKHGLRPCPWVGCRYHFADARVVDDHLVVDGRRLSLTANAVDADAFTEDRADAVVAMRATCVLDVADRNPDGVTLEETGEALDLTRERIRQIENAAKRRMVTRARSGGLR